MKAQEIYLVGLTPMPFDCLWQKNRRKVLSSISFAFTPLPLYPYAPSVHGVILSSISEGEKVILASLFFAFRRRKAKLRSPLYPYTPIPLCTFLPRLIFDFQRIAKLRRGDLSFAFLWRKRLIFDFRREPTFGSG